jgi:hypothetical protein
MTITATTRSIEYRLMTQYITSFVAVEEMIVTDGGSSRDAPVEIDVPVEVTPPQVSK